MKTLLLAMLSGLLRGAMMWVETMLSGMAHKQWLAAHAP